jgi:ABC-2 type transport system ATP-binding protein
MQALSASGLRSLISHPPTLEELFLRHYGVTDTGGGAEPAGEPAGQAERSQHV